ncbi:zinc-binding dehydrogenase [Acidicapsa ligni]|uniref:zinc-binding dehydrogenase n=1 Tax=Acidicapsa ligni TaxID=542300 RepID=UPI0021E0B7DC|nr:zinc-binding dehydrogenase [Acidicapsa ligni]
MGAATPPFRSITACPEFLFWHNNGASAPRREKPLWFLPDSHPAFSPASARWLRGRTTFPLPLVATTGDQLIRATKVEKGQTILLTGAVGSVGRMALFSALEIGAKVIAGVRKAQINEALKAGATEAIDVNDDAAIAKLPVLDAVADTVGGTVTTKIIGKVKPGGFLATVTSAPANASEFKVTVKAISSAPDPKAYVHYGTAVRDGKLVLPIEKTFPMAEAAEAQAFAEKGNVGKVVLTA